MHIELSSTAFIAFLLLALLVWCYKRLIAKENGHEAEFLEELTARHNHWLNAGEKEYADAYKVLLNKFTQIDDNGE